MLFLVIRGTSAAANVHVELARAMREEGKTLQQIADELGYKNRSSVSRIINQ